MAMLGSKGPAGLLWCDPGSEGNFFSCKSGRGYCADRCQRCRKDNHTSDTYRNSSCRSPEALCLREKTSQRSPAHKIVEMGMAHVPEGRRVFAEYVCL